MNTGNMLAPPPAAPPNLGRIAAIDLARGVAVALMILNHGVKGLLSFEQYPEWGLVPLHMITRFASSLFFIVFGVALAVAFVPKVKDASWPRRRLKLLLTGVTIYFWYKVLTVAEMLPYTQAQILDALLYRRSPSFVEILGFYGLVLLWIPFFLPLWARMPLVLRWLSPLIVAACAILLADHFHFWGSNVLQALLVEHPDYYTWGQLTRAPLVLLGLLIGELVLRFYQSHRGLLALSLIGTGLLLLGIFAAMSWTDLYEQLRAIAFNEGKHPPETRFMLFSMGGALAILGIALAGGELLARALRPITVIGSNALQAFIFHIGVIFVVLRFLLGWWQEVSYELALTVTLCLILATAVWIKTLDWVRAHS